MKHIVLPMSLAIFVTGCGGGSSSGGTDTPPSPPPPPASAVAVKVNGINFKSADSIVQLDAQSTYDNNSNLHQVTKIMKDKVIENIDVRIQPINEEDLIVCPTVYPEIRVLERQIIADDWSAIKAEFPKEQYPDCSFSYDHPKAYIVKEDGSAIYDLSNYGIEFFSNVISSNDPYRNTSNQPILETNLGHLALTIPDDYSKKLGVKELPYFNSALNKAIYDGTYSLETHRFGNDEGYILDNTLDNGFSPLYPDEYSTHYSMFIDHEGDFIVLAHGFSSRGSIVKIDRDSGVVAPKWTNAPIDLWANGRYKHFVLDSAGNVVDYTNPASSDTVNIGEGMIYHGTHRNQWVAIAEVHGQFAFTVSEHLNIFTRYDIESKELVTFNLASEGHIVDTEEGSWDYPIEFNEERVTIEVLNTLNDNKHFVEYNFETGTFIDHGVIEHKERLVVDITPM